MPVYGNGVNIEEVNGQIVITIDPSGDFGESASGKSKQIASTLGNVTLPSGITLGITAFRKKS